MNPASLSRGTKVVQVRRGTVRTPDAAERLQRILAEPVEFVHHDSFNRDNAEQTFFGAAALRVELRPWCNAADVPGSAPAERAPTLTTEQERALFLKFNYGRKRLIEAMNACKAATSPSRRNTEDAIAWKQRVEEVRSILVQANMPLVLAMAKRTRLGNIDFAELISEGNMALLRAIDKFDCSRGFKFSTYACRAIIKSFSRVAMRASRYRGRFPTEFDPTLEKSDYLDTCREATESYCVEELRSIMTRNLAALNDVEQRVIRARFALDTVAVEGVEPAPKTLEQVGQLIGVTKERVRQIQNRALAKLRIALEEGFLAA